ncbi:SDR family oxidoreductase [Nocardia sp. NPDC058705]|uniref:SDR family oxidoreductase n=1 Tax=Nocardia sp. NPDC058705 TaxID=3346609 RepID=UPI0036C88FB8
MESTALSGRVAVVTGVSRRGGIGFAVARRLARQGATLFLTHWAPHDAEQPWGAQDPGDVCRELGEITRVADIAVDLAAPTAAQAVIDAAVDAFGQVDILVANHARSGGDGDLFEMDAEMLDGHWAIDARSVLLLTKAFAQQYRAEAHPVRDRGRVIWMSSGQHLGPMRSEIAYAAAKSVLAGLTSTVAAELIERGILLNTVNPGPVDTGYLTAATADRDLAVIEEVRSAFPRGRVGAPDDPARLIAWLVSDEGRWLVGQVIDSEGGFRRSP